MKTTLFLFALCLGVSLASQAQSSVSPNKSCSVILLNHNWLINSYQKDEKITLPKNAKGTLAVHQTGDVTKKSFTGAPIPFKISIQKKSDNSVVSFSDQAVKKVEVNEILKKCESGDKIILLLPEENKYFLPHNQIEVR